MTETTRNTRKLRGSSNILLATSSTLQLTKAENNEKVTRAGISSDISSEAHIISSDEKTIDEFLHARLHEILRTQTNDGTIPLDELPITHRAYPKLNNTLSRLIRVVCGLVLSAYAREINEMALLSFDMYDETLEWFLSASHANMEYVCGIDVNRRNTDALTAYTGNLVRIWESQTEYVRNEKATSDTEYCERWLPADENAIDITFVSERQIDQNEFVCACRAAEEALGINALFAALDDGVPIEDIVA